MSICLCALVIVVVVIVVVVVVLLRGFVVMGSVVSLYLGVTTLFFLKYFLINLFLFLHRKSLMIVIGNISRCSNLGIVLSFPFFLFIF